MSNWQGKTIGRYQVTQLLGPSNKSSSCSVWLAIDTRNQQQVAIKLFPAVPASNRTYLIEVAAQARAVAVLEHPHILAVQDFGELETERGKIAPYVVMPYARGGTLADRMRVLNGMLPVYESLRYLRQAARGLDYAHSKQMLHRDVRPENMFLRQGWLQLADFGAVKILSSASSHGAIRPESRVPEYMAPELIDGREEAASDRYSLAVIAYQLFTGHFPFQGKTTYETLSRQARERPPEPRQFNNNMPVEVEQILMRGLAKRPEERPTSCAEFIDMLEFGWKASGKSADNPDSTWLAPWSKRWLADDEPSTPAEAVTFKVQPEQPAPAKPVAPKAQPEKVQATPIPSAQPVQSAKPAKPVKQPKETPATSQPAAQVRSDQAAWVPELPSWLPETLREAHDTNLAQFPPTAAPGMAYNARSSQPVSDPSEWSPELPSWLPAPFGEGPVNQPTRLWPKNPALQNPTFQSTQTPKQPPASSNPPTPITPLMQHAPITSVTSSEPSNSQKLQPYTSGYQEVPSRPDNIIQKPLSFDSIVRNAMSGQPTGETPIMAKESAPTHETPVSPSGNSGKQESFSGVVRGAITSQQNGASSIMMFQEGVSTRDNSAKFEAVVKQVMRGDAGVEPGQAPTIGPSMPTAAYNPYNPYTPVTPFPEASQSQMEQPQWEQRLKQWEQQLRLWLQQAYAWASPRMQEAYLQLRSWAQKAYVWVMQQLEKYGISHKNQA